MKKIDEKSKNEILKLKELPNERLEGSWGALWLGIRTFFGFKLGVVRGRARGQIPAGVRGQIPAGVCVHFRLFARNIGIPFCLLYLPYLTYLTYILTLLTLLTRAFS